MLPKPCLTAGVSSNTTRGRPARWAYREKATSRLTVGSKLKIFQILLPKSARSRRECQAARPTRKTSTQRPSAASQVPPPPTSSEHGNGSPSNISRTGASSFAHDRGSRVSSPAGSMQSSTFLKILSHGPFVGATPSLLVWGLGSWHMRQQREKQGEQLAIGSGHHIRSDRCAPRRSPLRPCTHRQANTQRLALRTNNAPAGSRSHRKPCVPTMAAPPTERMPRNRVY